MNSDIGFVYVIQMEGHPIYKIGRSSNVPRRLGEIGIQLPFRYRLCFTHRVPDVTRMETQIHSDLKEHRLNGEWFKLEKLQVEFIRRSLLFTQTEWLTQRLIERMVADDLYPLTLRRYARAFLVLARRNDRRLTALVDSHYYNFQDNEYLLKSVDRMLDEDMVQ